MLAINPQIKRIAVTDENASVQEIYSKCKELWRYNSILIKYDFPIIPLRPDLMYSSNGWEVILKNGLRLAPNPYDICMKKRYYLPE